MSTSSVWRSARPDGAENASQTPEGLRRQKLISVHDAATVSWQPGARKPRTRELQSMAGAGALGRASWGMLFGLLFLVPLLGAAVGAAAGAPTGRRTDVGIDDTSTERAEEEITPRTSALFVLTSDAVLDRVREAFAGERADQLVTDLSGEQEQLLRETFAD